MLLLHNRIIDCGLILLTGSEALLSLHCVLYVLTLDCSIVLKDCVNPHNVSPRVVKTILANMLVIVKVESEGHLMFDMCQGTFCYHVAHVSKQNSLLSQPSRHEVYQYFCCLSECTSWYDSCSLSLLIHLWQESCKHGKEWMYTSNVSPLVVVH